MLVWPLVLITPAALQVAQIDPLTTLRRTRPPRRAVLSCGIAEEADDALLEELRLIPAMALPAHLAVIMDGNARWARQRKTVVFEGHAAGVGALRTLISNAIQVQTLTCLTVFAFSAENWGRPRAEVDALLDLIRTTLEAEADLLYTRGVRIKFIGDLTRLPRALQAVITKLATRTPPQPETLELVIAVSRALISPHPMVVQPMCGALLTATLACGCHSSRMVGARNSRQPPQRWPKMWPMVTWSHRILTRIHSMRRCVADVAAALQTLIYCSAREAKDG